MRLKRETKVAPIITYVIAKIGGRLSGAPPQVAVTVPDFWSDTPTSLCIAVIKRFM